MLEDREPRNHKRDFAVRKLAHKRVPMTVRAVEHGEIAPKTAGFVDTLELASHPARLFLGRGELGDANSLALQLVGAKQFLGGSRANRVLSDYLGSHA